MPFYTNRPYNIGMTEKHSWSIREGEPTKWYERFRQYLLLGPHRTLFKAYMLCLSMEDPEEFKRETADKKLHNSPSDWSEMSNKWDWLLRAQDFDDFLYTDEGSASVARDIIKNATVNAALTLVEALQNQRLMVAASKEILDRGGVLASTININKTVEFTADEMADAAEQVAEWEKNAKSG